MKRKFNRDANHKKEPEKESEVKEHNEWIKKRNKNIKDFNCKLN